jgi:hypothetical protein
MNLIWSALVIGSVAPDFPYILGTDKYRLVGHTFPGVFLFTFPVSLFALWLFHIVIKRPIVRLLPAGFQQRLHTHLQVFKFGGLTRFAAIVFSLTVGLAIHIEWDAFTHPFTWPWRRWVWARSWTDFPLLGRIETYLLLQYASTVVGITALAVWVAMWYRKTPPLGEAVQLQEPDSGAILAAGMLFVATVAGILRAWLVTGIPRSVVGVDQFLAFFGFTSMAVAFWEVLAYCLLATTRRDQLT